MNQHGIWEWAGIVRAIGLTEKGMDPAETARKNANLRFVAERLEKSAASTDQFDGLRNLSNPALYVLADQVNSIIDQFLPYAVQMPFQIPAILGDVGATGVIQEHQRLPAIHGVQRFNLQPLKTGSIAVLEKEMLRSATPQAASFLSKLSLQAALKSSNKAAIEVLLSGGSSLHTITSSGASAAAVLVDLASAAEGLEIKADSKLFLIIDAKTAARLSLKSNAGVLSFPNLSTAGGEVNAAIRVIVVDTDTMPDPDSNGKIALLVDAAGLLINEGQFFFGRSDDATIEMSATPNETGAVVSLFQADLVALRTVRTFGLDLHRTAVAVIDGVAW